MRKGALGVPRLNRVLRPMLNSGGGRAGSLRTSGGGREVWVGNRVVRGRNDYAKGVFNGEHYIVIAAGVPVRIRVLGLEAERPDASWSMRTATGCAAPRTGRGTRAT